jgi:predicted small integral membrane protein
VLPREEFLMDFAWMAWTWQTALFFGAIASLLLIMTFLAVRRPEPERLGVLRIPTTRGDRLFISLVGTAFIQLAWLGLVGPNLWPALGLSLVYAAAVFRYV